MDFFMILASYSDLRIHLTSYRVETPKKLLTIFGATSVIFKKKVLAKMAKVDVETVSCSSKITAKIRSHLALLH